MQKRMLFMFRRIEYLIQLETNDYFQIIHTSSSTHTHLVTPSLISPLPTPQRPVTPRQHQVVSIRDNPCFDQNTTNNVNNSTLPNDVENTTGIYFFKLCKIFRIFV